MASVTTVAILVTAILFAMSFPINVSTPGSSSVAVSRLVNFATPGPSSGTLSVPLTLVTSASRPLIMSVSVTVILPAPSSTSGPVTILAPLAFFFLSFLLTSGFSFLATLHLLFFALPLEFLTLLASNLSLFFLDRSFFLSQFLTDPFSLGLTRRSLCRILLIGLGPPQSLCGSFVVAYFRSPQLTDSLLDGADINKFGNNLFGFLVYSGPFDGTFDERYGFATLKGQKLGGISLDFLFGYFEDGFGYFRFIVLNTIVSSMSPPTPSTPSRGEYSRWRPTCPMPVFGWCRSRLSS
jgi:hypothetical protein